jgi:DNA-binding transcriptional ArsR family regulator
MGAPRDKGQSEFETLLAMLKAVGDASRLRLLAIVASRQCSVEELASMLGLRTPTVSHHLAVLRKAGLVTLKRDGNTHLYRLDDVALAQLRKNFRSSGQLSRLISEFELGDWDKEVLQSCLVGRKLRELPSGRKKRAVILRWLAGRFERGHRYPERSVRETIARHHADCEMLMRELVAARLLKRTRDGHYLRTEA